jgi:hypothetical protein
MKLAGCGSGLDLGKRKRGIKMLMLTSHGRDVIRDERARQVASKQDCLDVDKQVMGRPFPNAVPPSC